MAKNYRWRDRPDIVARLVNADNIQTFTSRNVVLKPNEACALVIDGKIGDIVHDTILKNIGGGFARWLGDRAGMTATDRRLLFAMTGPMDIWVPFEGNLSNGEKVSGYGNLRMKINSDDLPKLLNIFANSAPILDREGLVNIVRTEFISRVVTPALAACSSAADLRNNDFLEIWEMRSEVEMRPLLSQMGVGLLKAFPVTEKTDMEKVEQLKAELAAAAAEEGAKTEHHLEQLANREAATMRRIEMETNVARARAAGQVAIELETELKALRAQEAHWEAELKRDTAQQQLAQQEREHAAQVRTEEADAKANRAMELFEQVQARKRERTAQQFDQQNQRMDKQNELQMQMMQFAAENEALTPEVMQEFLKQQTAQKAVDGSVTEISSAGSGSSTIITNSCANCGNSLQAEWQACPSCGTPTA